MFWGTGFRGTGIFHFPVVYDIKYSSLQLRVISKMQIQAVNDLGNLIFALVFLTTLCLTLALLYRKLRGRGIRGIAGAIFVCLSVYAILLLGVSFRSETRNLALGTDKCFDDWCATVTGAQSQPQLSAPAGMKPLAVMIRVSNRARRATFRPSQPRVMLVLANGETLVPSADALQKFEAQAGPQEDLGKRLIAGASFQTALVFEVPAGVREASVVLLEGPTLVTSVLVGDENSVFHKKMVYPIRID